MGREKYLIDTNVVIEYIGETLPEEALNNIDQIIDDKFFIKLPDAIIAATALVHGLTLITRNTKDFNRIEQLDVVNPIEL